MSGRFINVVLDAERVPNLVGEILRDCFFVQSDGYLGCYTTFELEEDVIPIPNQKVPYDIFEYESSMKSISGNVILMRYYWYGDGTLEFLFNDGSKLINEDCKKTNNWKYIDQQEQ